VARPAPPGRPVRLDARARALGAPLLGATHRQRAAPGP
jgi:hypothetical protein